MKRPMVHRELNESPDHKQLRLLHASKTDETVMETLSLSLSHTHTTPNSPRLIIYR
jgi:hypothetical protein